MLKLKEFWSKYKGFIVGIIIIVLLVLLILNTILLRKTQDKNLEQSATIELIKKMVETNKQILDENKKVIEEFEKENAKNKEVVITKTSYYENTKASPINTNYTNADLLKWLKSYESKANTKAVSGVGGNNISSKGKSTSTIKR